jgi:hypothetical protein
MVMGLLVMLALGLLPLRQIEAQSAQDPAFFALNQSELPSGFQITDSRVATNGTVIEQNLQPGKPLPDGRVSGYFLQARAVTATGGTASILSYLVSIFVSNNAAQEAFSDQHDFWQSEVASFGASAYEEDLGSFFLAHLYTLRDANGNTDSELFFQRGTIFFEVTLQNFATLSRDQRKAMLLAIAQSLESRSEGTPAPQTPTITPTPLPTATSTRAPRPTATAKPRRTSAAKPTPTRPKPTRTPSTQLTPTSSGTGYGHPVKEGLHCKKGHKLVGTRCRRIKPFA